MFSMLFLCMSCCCCASAPFLAGENLSADALPAKRPSREEEMSSRDIFSSSVGVLFLLEAPSTSTAAVPSRKLSNLSLDSLRMPGESNE